MINLDDTSQRVHFVGIGGVGVSAIAEILHNRGFKVSGSDTKSSDITQKLEHKGIDISYEHNENLVDGVHFLVYTTAVNFKHPELARAEALNIPCISRPVMLGMLMDEYANSIAVSGAHGKTTTSSMISMALERTQMDPTILIGGEVKDLGSNARVGASNILVAEACEYKESFLNFHPHIAVLLNIDADHLDYYRDLDHIVEAFERYVMGLPENGILIYNADDALCEKVAQKASCKIRLRFGLSECYEFHPTNISKNEFGYPNFTLVSPNESVDIDLSVPGEHNIYNVMAAYAATTLVGTDPTLAAEFLSLFTGAARRFDEQGVYNGARIIDDYAHHPSEVKATLKAARGLTHKKIICVFQPHTYTRTLELMNEFSTAFIDCDELIITDIYASREKDLGRVHSKDLVKRIEETGQSVRYIGPFEDIISHLKEIISEGDLVFTMGAGNVCELGKILVNL